MGASYTLQLPPHLVERRYSEMEAFLYFVAAVAIQYFMAPKPPDAKPAALSDFDIPTASESRPIPVVFGTVTITGSNCVWYGALRSVAIKD